MALSPVRILIADDHEMVRSALASFLGSFPGLKIVGTAGDGKEALVMAAAVCPDVVITDMNMPVMDGLEVTRHITLEFPEIKVIVFSNFLDDDRRHEAIQAGAVMCVQKDKSYHNLPDIILDVCSPPLL